MSPDSRPRVLLADDHLLVAGSQSSLGLMLQGQRRLEEAESLGAQALQSKQRAFGPKHFRTADTLGVLGMIAAKTGQRLNRGRVVALAVMQSAQAEQRLGRRESGAESSQGWPYRPPVGCQTGDRNSSH